jgi:hypothetical protein
MGAFWRASLLPMITREAQNNPRLMRFMANFLRADDPRTLGI